MGVTDCLPKKLTKNAPDVKEEQFSPTFCENKNSLQPGEIKKITGGCNGSTLPKLSRIALKALEPFLVTNIFNHDLV